MIEQLAATSLPYNTDQYALAERLSNRRARFPHDLADTALNDVATLTTTVFGFGLADAAPANREVRASEQMPEISQRTLGGNALLSTITLKENSVDQALAWQLTRERAPLN